MNLTNTLLKKEVTPNACRLYESNYRKFKSRWRDLCWQKSGWCDSRGVEWGGSEEQGKFLGVSNGESVDKNLWSGILRHVLRSACTVNVNFKNLIENKIKDA